MQHRHHLPVKRKSVIDCMARFYTAVSAFLELCIDTHRCFDVIIIPFWSEEAQGKRKREGKRE